jgi:ubiquitin carboxyl-terminal hydrolase 7
MDSVDMDTMGDTARPLHALANLSLQDDNQTPEAASPNSMMVDAPEEHVVEPNGTEPDDVAIIHPDSMDVDTLLASDCTLTRHARCPACFSYRAPVR